MSEESVRPIILISKCLEHDACRYNGEMIHHGFINRLKSFVTFKPVCPEMEIGLGVPRDPVRIVVMNDRMELLQPLTDTWFTREMESFCESCLSSLVDVDGFILKNRSPSCGFADVKQFQGTSKSAGSRKGAGFFGGEVLKRFPGYPVEDEGRLNNFFLREHFLTALFAMARFREMRRKQEISDLLQFHQDHKLLFMAYNQNRAKKLGQICGNQKQLGLDQVFESYLDEMKQLFAKPPHFGSMINALMHAFGGISKGLSADERQYFLQAIEEYRDERIPVSSLIYLLRSWAIRFQKDYLRDQVLLDPYPSDLIDLTNTGKKRF